MIKAGWLSYLGYCLVVDVDQVSGGRVDLEGLVEGKSSIKLSGSYTEQC
jgi:hypothetical protein